MAAKPIAIERPDAPPIVSVGVPGSKSVTCRAIVLGALASSPVELHNALLADDTRTLLAAVDAMGVDTSIDARVMHIAGGGPGHPRVAVLDMGLGGAPARFALALAAMGDAPVVLDGGARLRERPMQDAIDLLGAVGVVVEPVGNGPGLPLRVTPSPWATHSLTIADTATSQVVSSLLLIGASAGGLDITFTQPPTSAAYIELTIAVLGQWGIDVDVQRLDGVLHRVCVAAGSPNGSTHTIPADASSVVTAACLSCVTPGAEVTLLGVSPHDEQPDTAALTLLHNAGASFTSVDTALHITAPETLHFPAIVDAAAMPDAVPVLAALAAARATDTVRFTGLSTLRVKECDRIAGMRQLLHAMGGEAVIEGDDLLVTPLVAPLGASARKTVTLPTMDDHRMAMAGAVLGLWRGGVEIDDPDVVTKSWPTFWSDLAPLGGWAAP